MERAAPRRAKMSQSSANAACLPQATIARTLREHRTSPVELSLKQKHTTEPTPIPPPIPTRHSNVHALSRRPLSAILTAPLASKPLPYCSHSLAGDSIEILRPTHWKSSNSFFGASATPGALAADSRPHSRPPRDVPIPQHSTSSRQACFHSLPQLTSHSRPAAIFCFFVDHVSRLTFAPLSV